MLIYNVRVKHTQVENISNFLWTGSVIQLLMILLNGILSSKDDLPAGVGATAALGLPGGDGGCFGPLARRVDLDVKVITLSFLCRRQCRLAGLRFLVQTIKLVIFRKICNRHTIWHSLRRVVPCVILVKFGQIWG